MLPEAYENIMSSKNPNAEKDKPLSDALVGWNAQKGGNEYFSFSLDTFSDRHFTNWMTLVNGKLHDASYVDDTYDDHAILTSPLVSIPAPVNSVDDVFRDDIRNVFLSAISAKVGFEVDVPMLCEASDAEKIVALKKAVGYSWDSTIQDYVSDEKKKTATILLGDSIMDARKPLRVLVSAEGHYSGESVRHEFAEEEAAFKVFHESLVNLAKAAIEDGTFSRPRHVIDFGTSCSDDNIRLIKLDEDHYVLVNCDRTLVGDATGEADPDMLLDGAKEFDDWVKSQRVSFGDTITLDDLPYTKEKYLAMPAWVEIPRKTYDQELSENCENARNIVEPNGTDTNHKINYTSTDYKYAELNINTSTAAFDDLGVTTEIRNILYATLNKVNDDWDGKPIMLNDTNGNHVGVLQLLKEKNNYHDSNEGLFHINFNLHDSISNGEKDQAMERILIAKFLLIVADKIDFSDDDLSEVIHEASHIVYEKSGDVWMNKRISKNPIYTNENAYE